MKGTGYDLVIDAFIVTGQLVNVAIKLGKVYNSRQKLYFCYG